MRKTRDFRQFVQERYDGGKAQIPHPDPQRRKKHPTVKFWTAMKYDTFKAKVKKEFEAWRQEVEAKRPRGEVGARIGDIAELRTGDFVHGRWQSDRYKVIKKTPKSAILVQVDEFGRPTGPTKYRWTNERLKSWKGRLTRMEELKRPEVSLDEVKKFLEAQRGPGRDIDSQEKYREFLRQKLTQQRHAPYRRLGDDEPEHKDRLKEQIEEILKERGVGKDWEWEPPPHIDIGERVRDGFQLRKGDFIEREGRQLRVLDIDDSGSIKVQRVDRHGRPNRAPFVVSYGHLDYPRVKRIEPVKRKEVSAEEAAKFAADYIGFPERDVGDYDAYRKWLTKQFLDNSESPYAGLGEDEKAHWKALDKAIDKVLKDRDITKKWKWQPPPHAEIGDRVHDPYQLHTGDFFSQRDEYGYKVLEVKDDGSVRVQRFNRSNGMPVGHEQEYSRDQFKRGEYRRVEPIVRPKPSNEEALRFADREFPHPERGVTSFDAYKNWLRKQFLTNHNSPYYQLGEDDKEHQKLLDEQIKKILKARKIGKDWKWTPPEPIKLPANKDWEQEQDAIRRLALGGEVVDDSRLGKGGINQSRLRRLELDGKTGAFVYKPRDQETGVFPGQQAGSLHLREQAAYNVDRLIGDGAIVPPTVSDGKGSYQHFIDGATTVGHGSSTLKRLGSRNVARNPDVIRHAVLMALLGSEDDHGNNVMMAWKDPDGPHTVDNLRIINIDNGYTLADGKPIRAGSRVSFRDPWAGLGILGHVYKRALPKELYDQIKAIDIKDYIDVLAKGGAPVDREGIEAAVFRLMAFQDDPKLMAKLVERYGVPRAAGWDSEGGGLTELQYMSHRDPEKLFREFTSYDESEIDKVKKMVAEVT